MLSEDTKRAAAARRRFDAAMAKLDLPIEDIHYGSLMWVITHMESLKFVMPNLEPVLSSAEDGLAAYLGVLVMAQESCALANLVKPT